MSQQYLNIIGFLKNKKQEQGLGAEIRSDVSSFHSKGYNYWATE